MSYGWRAFWKNVWPLVGLAVIIVVVHLVLGAIASNASNVVGRLVIQLVSFVVGIVLAMGLIRASLAVLEGRRPEVGMLFQTEGFVILGLMWEFFGYVIVENPTISPTEAMRRSAEITKGYRWQLLGLTILLFLINVVGVLALGVGLFFTYGISAVTLAYAYKVLSGQGVAPA